jgi:hypothetical protein
VKEKIKKIFFNKRNLVILYILFALAASISSLVSKKNIFKEDGTEYTCYNNYIIFERSFYHLKNNQDLYVLYPQEYFDLYKYTPTFSVFFGVFALFPDWLGVNLWNLLNALFLLAAVYFLPKLNKAEKAVILLIILNELMTSVQNEQSNALIAGLLVLSLGLLENKKYLIATLCIVFSAYIKFFGLAGFALFLFYPNKLKLGLYSAMWTIILFAVPLVFIDFNQYTELYKSYWRMLAKDHDSSYGYSVMGWFNAWFGISLNKNLTVLLGMILFFIPFVRINVYKQYTFKLLALSSTLVWIVIFNHKAESPTFIIAMTGIALWFMTSKRNLLNTSLFICAFILTSLSPTDLFPKFLKEEFVKPYMLKVFPCILIWIKIVYDMLVLKKENKEEILVLNHVK